MPVELFTGDDASLTQLRVIARDDLLRNRRFIARNFLLDENVSSARATRYNRDVPSVDGLSAEQWSERHERYVSSSICVGESEAYALGSAIDRDDHQCPDTFRDPFALRDYASADEQLHLLRIETASGLASVIAREAGNRLAVAQRLSGLALQAGPFGTEDPDASIELDRVLEPWRRNIDRRPAFVTWAGPFDEELFGEEPGDDAPDWADELRDQLGLYRIEPGEVLVLFRYAVGDLPRFVDDPNIQPLAVPTVLDSRFAEAFCPAPRNRAAGHTVDLTGFGRLQPELLHPAIRLRASHVFRVGQVSRPVPADLEPCRRAHFTALRETTGRSDYGAGIDP